MPRVIALPPREREDNSLYTGANVNMIMNQPLVSTIIIFLNSEKFISEAVESVLGQSYSNWELFLVDDGSSDNSTQIAKEYASRLPQKIYYLEHDGHRNQGMSAARNLGIGRAKGQFIAFLDSDDVWLPQYLERQVEILMSHPEAGMVYGPAQRWFSWAGNPEGGQRDSVQDLGIELNALYKPPALLQHFLKNNGATPCPCSILVRRDVICQIGGFEETFRGMYEDQVFCTKVSSRAQIFVSGECWSKYRRHPNSACAVAGKSGEYNASRLAFLKWLEEYLTKTGVRDRTVWSVLRKELFVYRHPTLHHLMSRGGFASYIRGIAKSAISPMRRLLRLSKGISARMRVSLKIEPLSQLWGLDRGKPIHRYYLETFLKEFSSLIRGNCLEFQEDSYTTRFGGSSVCRIDILHIDNTKPQATIVADLTKPNDIPDKSFDCIICTHVLHIIFELDKAVSELHRILKPGGVLMVAVPHISMCGLNTHELWRFTPEGLHAVLAKSFGPDNVNVHAYGNSLTAAGDLRGLVVHEFTKTELNFNDPRFAVEVCALAARRDRPYPS
jgi:glycosyltransferase involved in cell wall biosynthesis